MNLVATAVLNARNSFALPVFAPTVNNLVVITTYLVFAVMRGGQAPSLDLTIAQKLVLALGTTAGVVAFCLVPLVGLWRSGFHLRPRFEFRDPVLRRLARDGLLGGRVPRALAGPARGRARAVQPGRGWGGGLPTRVRALPAAQLPFAVPVFTTSFPTLTRYERAGDTTSFAAEVGRSARSIAFLTFGSAAALVALSEPLAALVARGNASSRGSEIAGAIAAFALGLPAYSFILFLTRVSYAYGDTPAPTVANLVVAVLGTAGMWAIVEAVDVDQTVTAIGVGFSIAQVVGAALLALTVRRRLRARGAVVRTVAVPLARSLVSAVIGGAVGWAVSAAVLDAADGSTSGVVAATTAAIAGAAVLVGVVFAVQWLLLGPSPSRSIRTLGAAPGRQALR